MLLWIWSDSVLVRPQELKKQNKKNKEEKGVNEGHKEVENESKVK